MRTLRTLSVLLLASASTLLAQTSTTNPIVSYAYVGTYSSSTPRHTYGYAIHANGSSSAISGSPFAGVSGYLANTLNYVFTTDGHSIETYHRSTSGSLSAVATIDGTAHNDTPQGSGVGLLTLDRTGSTLYAGEIDFQGASNNAYAEFHKLSNGSLSFFANSPINVNDGGELTFSHSNAFAYTGGCYFATWTLLGFYRATDGKLTPFDTGNTFPPDPNNYDYCPGAIASSARNYLAVSYAAFGAQEYTHIEIYKITSSGALQKVSSKGTIFRSVNSVRFESTGNYLAVAGDKGIAIYKLNSNATLSRITPSVDSSISFKEVRWDDNRHLIARTSSALYVFNFANGVLSQAGSAHGISNTTLSLAVTPLQ